MEQETRVLDFFKKNPKNQFYLRELGRKIDIDAGNLSRVLKKMVAGGQLLSEKKGNQIYFRLPESVGRITCSQEEIEAVVKRLEPDLIKFCQDLIRIPSVSGENPEEKIALFIYNQARGLGLRSQIIAKEKTRPNVIVDSNTNKERCFLFLGHMDTVGIGAIDNWRYYPFSAHLAGGRIYGRGAADMKGGIACELYLLKLIDELGLDLPFNVRLVLVSNEEGGSTTRPIFDLGMEYLVKEGYIDGEAAIYGYGGSYNIGIGHRGILRVKVTTLGEAVHTGSSKWEKGRRGVNAVTGMAEILLAMEKFKLPQKKHPHFPYHSNIITPGTMILHGGSAVSMVPDTCESTFEIRYLPGFPIRKVFHQIKEKAEKICQKRPGLKVNFEKFVEIPVVCLSPEEKLVKIAAKASEEVYKEPITARGFGPANESFMLIERGIPTIVFGPIGGRAHSDDEFVELNSLTKTVSAYLKILLAWPEK